MTRRYCSFCGRWEGDDGIAYLVVGPGDDSRTVMICNNCVQECAGAMAAHARAAKPGPIFLSAWRRRAQLASWVNAAPGGDAA